MKILLHHTKVKTMVAVTISVTVNGITQTDVVGVRFEE